jgi:hypothetical protein
MQIQNKVREMEMKTTIILIMVALIAISTSAMAAKVVNVPIPHPPFLVYQAYCGDTCTGVGNQCFLGFNGLGEDVIEAVPGILCIVPGETATYGLPEPGVDWTNYVTASIEPGGPSDGKWTVTNTSLKKTVPTYDCTVAIGGAPVLQQGSANIRRWWPLMYELPGTKWLLTITTKTVATWDDDGTGPNAPAATHQDTWTWQVDATLDSLGYLVDLFHELPVGSCQVPLISSESLYGQIEDSITALKGMDPTDPNMADEFNAFILLIEDNCVTVDCGTCSPDLGIRNTTENPACCKILADLDFIAAQLDVNIPGK